MMRVTECPSQAELQNLLDDQTPLPELSSGWLAHLNGCARCRDTLTSLSRVDSVESLFKLVQRNRNAVPPPEFLLHEPDQPQHTIPSRTPAEQQGIDTSIRDRHDTTPKTERHNRATREPGEIIGKYRLEEQIGEGGMGAIYKATHVDLGKTVAIKFVLSDDIAPLDWARFIREAKQLAKIQHPNVVIIHDAELQHQPPYLVMEYLHGQSLKSRLENNTQLPAREAVQIAIQVATGLAAIHAIGLIHRDIKPANVYVLPDGTIKLLDLGLSRPIEKSAEDYTRTGVMVGTPAYMPPEQANCTPLDTTADIYSLGVVLYQMLAGQVPFRGKSVWDLLASVMNDVPTPLREYRPELPNKLISLVHRMLAKNREERPQTTNEVIDALTEISAQLATPQVAPVRKRSRRMLFAVLALSLFGFALAAGVIHRISTDEGTLVIETFDDDIVVEVKNRDVTITDAKTGSTTKLKSGTYQVTLKDAKPGVTLETTSFVIKRGEKVVVRVQKVPAGTTSAEPSPKIDTPIVLSNALDLLKATDIPEAERRPWHPKELVCILGSHAKEPEPTASVAFSKTGSHLLVGNRNGTASWWNLAQLKKDHSQTNRAGESVWVTLSADNQFALLSGWHQRIQLWNPLTNKSIATFGRDGHDEVVMCKPTFVPGKREMLIPHRTEHNGKVHLTLWSVDEQKPKRTAIIPRYINAVAVEPNGKRFVTCGQNRVTQLWDTETLQFLPTLPVNPACVPACVAWSPSGDYLLVGEAVEPTLPGFVEGKTVSVMKLFDVSDTANKLLATYETKKHPLTVVWSPNGKHFAYTSGSGQLVVRETATGEVRFLCDSPGEFYDSLAFSPDGRHLAVGTLPGAVYIFRLKL